MRAQDVNSKVLGLCLGPPASMTLGQILEPLCFPSFFIFKIGMTTFLELSGVTLSNFLF